MSSFSRLSLTAFEPSGHSQASLDLHPQPEGHILHRSTKILSHGWWAAAAWPLAARAEQSTMPVVGFLIVRPWSRLLLNAGRIGPGMADALKVEARRRAEVDPFYGLIVFASVVARRPRLAWRASPRLAIRQRDQ